LGQVIGQCVALTPAPTVAEQNRAESCKPEHGFMEPSRPNGRRTFTVCYMTWERITFYYIYVSQYSK